MMGVEFLFQVFLRVPGGWLDQVCPGDLAGNGAGPPLQSLK